MKKILPLACAALITANVTVKADTQAYVDVLFDWAESKFSDLFPPKGTSQRIENTITSDEIAGLDFTAARDYAAVVQQISAGETNINLPASLDELNNNNTTWLYRTYTNPNLIGVNFKLLTPNVTLVCIRVGEINCFNNLTLPQAMLLVPANAVDGPKTECATVPTIETGAVVTYSVDNKAKTNSTKNQEIIATYTTTSPTKIVAELIDTSLDSNPPAVNKRNITQNIEVANGWSYLKSLKIDFLDDEVNGTNTLTTNSTRQLTSPSGTYCLGQNWTTNAVQQVITGQVVTADGTVQINENSIDDSVKVGSVVSISDSVTIGSKTYDTVKVVSKNILTDITTTTWFDKDSGIDVKEVLTDNRNADAVIVETTVTEIK